MASLSLATLARNATQTCPLPTQRLAGGLRLPKCQGTNQGTPPIVTNRAPFASSEPQCAVGENQANYANQTCGQLCRRVEFEVAADRQTMIPLMRRRLGEHTPFKARLTFILGVSLMLSRWLLISLCSFCCVPLLSAADPVTPILIAEWPQWRGPSRDAKSTETGINTDWNAKKPNLLWMAEGFGGGFASVSIQGNKIFTTGNFADGQAVICYDSAKKAID